MSGGIIALIIIIVVLGIVTVAKSATVINQAQKGLVERFGKYKETLEPGLKIHHTIYGCCNSKDRHEGNCSRCRPTVGHYQR